MMRGGSIVDASLIQAPSSTKNEKKERDPEMHQTKKGNQYYFGMKVHIGVDAGSGCVHSLETTAANVHDITKGSSLIRDDDTVVYGDSGYLGIAKREEVTSNEHLASIDYRINRRVGSIQKVPVGLDYEKQIERRKSSVRSKVEHPFLVVKRFFVYSKNSIQRFGKKYSQALPAVYQCQHFDEYPGWQTTASLRTVAFFSKKRGTKGRKERIFIQKQYILRKN